MLKVILLIVLLAIGVVAYNTYEGKNSASDAGTQQTALPTPTQGTGSLAQKPNPSVAPSSKPSSTVAPLSSTGASTSGAGKPVHMVLTESQITSKIEQEAGSGQAGGLQSVQVKLGNGLATIDGTTTVAGITVPIEATAQLGASDGLLSVNVTSIKAGNVDLPAPVEDQLLQQVKQTTGLKDLQKIDVGMYVTSVQVQPGQVVIDGQTR